MSLRDDCSKSGILRSRRAKVRQSLRQSAIEVGLESSDEGELAFLLAMESLPQSARSSPPRATSMQRAVSLPPGSPTAGTSTAPTPPPFPSRRTPSTGRSPPSTGRAPSTGHEAAKLDSLRCLPLLPVNFVSLRCPSSSPVAFARHCCPSPLPVAFARRLCPSLLPVAFARRFARRFCPLLLPVGFFSQLFLRFLSTSIVPWTGD